MIFTDEKDMSFDAYFILVNGGRLIIGEEGDGNEYQSKLVITLHGNYWDK